MKTTIAALVLTLTGFSHAGDITKEDFIDLLKIHKEKFETVEIGMSVQTYKRLMVRGENTNEMCSMFLNETVVSVDYPQYSVLSEEYYLTDCGPNREKGKMNSFTTNKWAYTLEKYIEDLIKYKEHHQYSLSSMNEVTATWGDPSASFPSAGFEVLELGVSQFYNITSYDGIIIDTTMLGRGWVKPELSKEVYEASK